MKRTMKRAMNGISAPIFAVAWLAAVMGWSAGASGGTVQMTSFEQCFQEAKILLGLTAVAAEKAREFCTAPEVVRMTSLRQCAHDARSLSGLALNSEKMKELCMRPGVVQMNSVAQCIQEAHSFEGLALSEAEARDFCFRR